MTPYDILITGADILTAEPGGGEPGCGEPGAALIRGGIVGITGDRITLVSGPATGPANGPATGPAAGPIEAHRTIDARGHLLLPGFVNVHTHAVLAMTRGMTEDMGFAPAYTPGVPHVLDPTEDEAAALAQLTGLELMLAGSTTVNDMYAHAHATLPAMAALGLRISSSAWIHDVDFTGVHNGVFEYDPAIGARTLRYGIDLAERFQGAFGGRASVMLAPHAIDTCSRQFLKDVAAERDRMGVRVMTHVAQSRIEVNQVMARDGMTPMELVDDAGLLDERLIAAHCVVVTETDIARAGRAGITVAHCPKVNMTGGWLPQSAALRRAGARIAIGTDNMHGDVIEVLRWALASARLQECRVGPGWQPEDVLHMATLGAAAAMGRAHDLGSIAVGKQADLVLWDMRRAHLTPAFHPERTLVHCGTGRDVATVIIAGTIVVDGGRATLVDEERFRHAGQAAAAALWTRVTGYTPTSRRVLGA